MRSVALFSLSILFSLKNKKGLMYLSFELLKTGKKDASVSCGISLFFVETMVTGNNLERYL